MQNRGFAIRNAWSFDFFPGPMSEDDSESFCISLDCAGVNDEKLQSDSFVFSFAGISIGFLVRILPNLIE